MTPVTGAEVTGPEVRGAAVTGPEVTAVVLAGGGSVRFGSDKLVAQLGGTSVLDHLFRGLPPQWPVVAVGAVRPVHRAVRWVREDPPGGGPLAGIAAGIECVTTELVVVVGGDMPFAGPAAVSLVTGLVASRGGGGGGASYPVEARTARLADGRAQPLLTAFVTEAARRALPADPTDGRARLLLERIAHAIVPVDPIALLDVDTPEALAAAARVLGVLPQ